LTPAIMDPPERPLAHPDSAIWSIKTGQSGILNFKRWVSPLNKLNILHAYVAASPR
jgi:hypothetical protein